MPDNSPPDATRLGRLWKASESRGIPLRTILVTVLVVVLVFLAGKLIYRLRPVILLVLVAGFVALILNPLVVALQRWRIRRRGWAVAVVTLWAVLVFAGLAVAFGYPLTNAINHLSQRLPSYVNAAQHGTGWIGHLARKYHVLVVGAAQHAQAGELRAGPGQARPQPGQGRPVAAAFAADHFHPGAAPAAGRAQAAHRRARPDVTRAGGALFADGAGGQPVGHRVHAGEHPDLGDSRAPSSW